MRKLEVNITNIHTHQVINYHLSKCFQTLNLENSFDYVWVGLPDSYLLIDGQFLGANFQRLKHFELLPAYDLAQVQEILDKEEMEVEVEIEEDDYGTDYYKITNYKDTDLLNVLSLAVIDYKQSVSLVGMNQIIDGEYHFYDKLDSQTLNNNQISLLNAIGEVAKMELQATKQ